MSSRFRASLISIPGFLLIFNAHALPKDGIFRACLLPKLTEKLSAKTSAIERPSEAPDLSRAGLRFIDADGRNGLWYADSTGTKWLVKPDSIHKELQTAAEVIASAIYRRLGYSAAETRLIIVNGKRFTAAKEIGGKVHTDLSGMAQSPEVRQLRVFAAYLKDWDRVIGSNNFRSASGKIDLIDFGGSLGSRAQGEFKPGRVQSPAVGSFENTTDFFDVFGSFRTDSLSHAHPFLQLTRKDAIEAIDKLKRLDRPTIEAIVDAAHYSNKADRDYMVAALLNRREAITKHLLSQFPESIPTSTEIQNRLFAVHGTNVFPSSGVLKAGTMALDPRLNVDYVGRNTVHFSLGELVRPNDGGNWENQKFAVVTPLKGILPHLVNLHPYDSFALGDVKIPVGSFILVPKGTAVPHIPGIQVISYEGKLRDAIDSLISKNNGWSVSMRNAWGQARLGDFNLSQPDFFKDILKDHPGMSFGWAALSLKGQAQRFERIEVAASKFLHTYFNHEDTPSARIAAVSSSEELVLVKKYLQFQMDKLDQYFKTPGMPLPSVAAFEKQKQWFKGISNLIGADLQLRTNIGKTFQNAAPDLLKQLIEERDNAALLATTVKELQQRASSRLNPFAPKDTRLYAVPKFNRKMTLQTLVDFAWRLSQSDAQEFVRANWKFSSRAEEEQFWRDVELGRRKAATYTGQAEAAFQ